MHSKRTCCVVQYRQCYVVMCHMCNHVFLHFVFFLTPVSAIVVQFTCTSRLQGSHVHPRNDKHNSEHRSTIMTMHVRIMHVQLLLHTLPTGARYLRAVTLGIDHQHPSHHCGTSSPLQALRCSTSLGEHTKGQHVTRGAH